MPELDGWRHCPRCGGALERSEENKVECPECGFLNYGSSKATAGALCFDEGGRLLLSRRGAEPFKDQWDIPGGFLEEGEHPLDGLRRELDEEAGVEIEPLDFVGAWIDEYGPRGLMTLNLYWTARIVSGDPHPADDVEEFRWFLPEEISPGELAFNHLPEVLERVRGAPPARS